MMGTIEQIRGTHLMELTYRGISYNSDNTAIETVDTGITAKYRGQTYSIRTATVPATSTSKMLKYRGVTYSTGTAKVRDSRTPQIPANSVPAFS